jgi:transcriptional regulator with XRE-family HTH domain
MKIDDYLTDAAVLSEIGGRLKRARVDANLTQAQLAQQAGIAKRTVERLESGDSSDSLVLIRVLRVLKLLGNLENLLPDMPQSPVTLLKRHGQQRKRVRAGPITNEETRQPEAPWAWGK